MAAHGTGVDQECATHWGNDMNEPTQFILYFSTAEEALGYAIIDDHGTAMSEFVGGPNILPGTYRLEDQQLRLVDLGKTGSFPRKQGSRVTEK